MIDLNFFLWPLVRIAGVPHAADVGWTIVHSLWQGAAIAMIVEGIVRVIRTKPAASCWLYLGGMCAVLLAMTTTFDVLVNRGHALATEAVSFSTVSAASGSSVDRSSKPIHTVLSVASTPPRPWLQSIAGAWMLGVAVISLWHAVGWVALQRFRRSSGPLNDARIIDLLNRHRDRFGIRRVVDLRVSDRIGSPILIGWLKVAVYFPATTISGLSIEHLEALVAHELAHVKRHDYLINLFQIGLESLMFYNPAAWWLSRQVRMEREMACDEMALENLAGGRNAYSAALLAAEGLRIPSLTIRGRVLAVFGAPLRTRIERLLVDRRPSTLPLPTVAMTLMLLFAATSALLAQTRPTTKSITELEPGISFEPVKMTALETLQAKHRYLASYFHYLEQARGQLLMAGCDIPKKELDTHADVEQGLAKKIDELKTQIGEVDASIDALVIERAELLPVGCTVYTSNDDAKGIEIQISSDGLTGAAAMSHVAKSLLPRDGWIQLHSYSKYAGLDDGKLYRVADVVDRRALARLSHGDHLRIVNHRVGEYMGSANEKRCFVSGDILNTGYEVDCCRDPSTTVGAVLRIGKLNFDDPDGFTIELSRDMVVPTGWRRIKAFTVSSKNSNPLELSTLIVNGDQITVRANRKVPTTQPRP